MNFNATNFACYCGDFHFAEGTQEKIFVFKDKCFKLSEHSVNCVYVCVCLLTLQVVAYIIYQSLRGMRDSCIVT